MQKNTALLEDLHATLLTELDAHERRAKWRLLAFIVCLALTLVLSGPGLKFAAAMSALLGYWALVSEIARQQTRAKLESAHLQIQLSSESRHE